MAHSIFKNWTFIRLLRLVIGVAIIAQAISNNDFVFGFAGLLFSGMAIFNIGCCGTGSCNIFRKEGTTATKDINYEEVV